MWRPPTPARCTRSLTAGSSSHRAPGSAPSSSCRSSGWDNRSSLGAIAPAPCASPMRSAPHLGAHLGPKSGGVVRDFQFDVAGRCAATPLGPPPRKARLQTYPVEETGGFIFAYWDHQGRPPAWRLPEIDAGYRACACAPTRRSPPRTPSTSATCSTSTATTTSSSSRRPSSTAPS